MADHSSAIKGKYVVVDPNVEIGEGTSIWNQVYVGPDCRIGENVRIASQVHIGKSSVIGDRAFIQTHAVIADFSMIGADCFIGPGVIFVADPYPPMLTSTGVAGIDGVTVEEGAIIGAGAIIHAGVTVGRRAVVSMGAMVTADVPPESVVIGSPARPVFKRSDYDKRQAEHAEKWKSRKR